MHLVAGLRCGASTLRQAQGRLERSRKARTRVAAQRLFANAETRRTRRARRYLLEERVPGCRVLNERFAVSPAFSTTELKLISNPARKPVERRYETTWLP